LEGVSGCWFQRDGGLEEGNRVTWESGGGRLWEWHMVVQLRFDRFDGLRIMLRP